MAFAAMNAVKANGGLDLTEEAARVGSTPYPMAGRHFLDTTTASKSETCCAGIIVLSGNDALCGHRRSAQPDGSEAGFARLMTQRAQQMGMTNSYLREFQRLGQAAGHRMIRCAIWGCWPPALIAITPQYYPMFCSVNPV